MISEIMGWLNRYWNTLFTYLSREWQQLTPTKYGILLVLVGVFGWFFMKSGMKKPGT